MTTLEETITNMNIASTEFNEKLEAMRKEFTEKTKGQIGGLFYQFLTRYESLVGAVTWTQYTPHFNDGEDCEFTVHELQWIEPKEDGEYDDDCEHREFYEFSNFQDELDKLIKLKSQYLEWEADPLAAALAYEETSKTRWRPNGWFFPENYEYPREIQTGHFSTHIPDVLKKREKFEAEYRESKIANWKPSHYASSAAVQVDIDTVKSEIEKSDGIKEMSTAINTVFSNIEDRTMMAIYGDHVRVVVQLTEDKCGTKVTVTEYDHD